MNPEEHLATPIPPAAISPEQGDPEHEPAEVSELRLDAEGIWELRSASRTVYLLDLDRRLLMRQRGTGSPSGDFDDEWVPLVDVTSARGDHGVVRVGDRHRFLTDPNGGVHDYRYWIPRTCNSIVQVPRPVTDAPPKAQGA